MARTAIVATVTSEDYLCPNLFRYSEEQKGDILLFAFPGSKEADLTVASQRHFLPKKGDFCCVKAVFGYNWLKTE